MLKIVFFTLVLGRSKAGCIKAQRPLTISTWSLDVKEEKQAWYLFAHAINATSTHHTDLFFRREGHGTFKVEAIKLVISLKLLESKIHLWGILIICCFRIKFGQVHDGRFEVQLRICHEGEDRFVIVIAADSGRYIMTLRNLWNIWPLVTFITNFRLVKQTIAVFKTANEHKLVFTVSSNFDNSRTHASCWQFSYFFAFFESHIRIECEHSSLLNESLVSQLEG